MAELEGIFWSSRLPPVDNVPDAEAMAALARSLIQAAVEDLPDDVRGNLAAFLGDCLAPGITSETVCRVAYDVISPHDVVMVAFADGRPPIAKVYLGTHTPDESYCEFPDYAGEFLVLWAANPEVAALVPKDEVGCLWPVRALWSPLEGWQPFGAYPFTQEQKARLESFQGFAIASEQLIPHFDVVIDTGVPR